MSHQERGQRNLTTKGLALPWKWYLSGQRLRENRSRLLKLRLGCLPQLGKGGTTRTLTFFRLLPKLLRVGKGSVEFSSGAVCHLQNLEARGWRNSSVAQSSCCFCRSKSLVPGANLIAHNHPSLQFLEHSVLFWPLQGPYMREVQLYTWRQTNPCNPSCNLENFPAWIILFSVTLVCKQLNKTSASSLNFGFVSLRWVSGVRSLPCTSAGTVSQWARQKVAQS